MQVWFMAIRYALTLWQQLLIRRLMLPLMLQKEGAFTARDCRNCCYKAKVEREKEILKPERLSMWKNLAWERIKLSRDTECCHLKCLKQFSTAHLYGLREKFKTFFVEQNLYLHSLIGRQETKNSVCHPQQPRLVVHKQESSYTFVYYL